jgi:thiol-disulfide isomerase/thioredoxin
MKPNIILLCGFLSLIVCFTACKKHEPKEEILSKEVVITNPPSQFEAKAVIELFGGEWCGTCPAGVDKMEALMNANPNKVFGTVVHFRDAFETEHHNILFGHLGGVAAYPSAAINRGNGILADSLTEYAVYNQPHWESNVKRFINKKTQIGLAIETSIEDNKPQINVHIHNKEVDSNKTYYLTVYFLEDNVPSIAQVGKGADYTHRMLLRGSLTEALGNVISLNSNVTLVKSFQLNLNGSLRQQNVKILAFLHTHKSANSKRAILNAQQVKLGETVDWD